MTEIFLGEKITSLHPFCNLFSYLLAPVTFSRSKHASDSAPPKVKLLVQQHTSNLRKAESGQVVNLQLSTAVCKQRPLRWLLSRLRSTKIPNRKKYAHPPRKCHLQSDTDTNTDTDTVRGGPNSVGQDTLTTSWVGETMCRGILIPIPPPSSREMTAKKTPGGGSPRMATIPSSLDQENRIGIPFPPEVVT